MNKNILVVAAHPDHEVLGCGGTISRMVKNGYRADIFVLSEGLTARWEKRELADKKQLETLHNNFRKSCKLLGFQNPTLLNLPDNRMDSIEFLDIVKAIEKKKREVKPSIIFTDFYGDLNIDHRLTFEAVMTACRPVAGETVREIYCHEIPSSTEWALPGQPFVPNLFVDVGDTIEKKLEAWKLYDTESRPFPFPRSPEALRISAQKWGSVCGFNYAEAFVQVRRLA